MGFPCSSVGKESAYNAGDLGSVPGLGRSPGEGNRYPLQYSGLENSMDYVGSDMTEPLSLFRFLRPSLVAQLIKNLPAMQETWVQFLGWEDPLEKEMAIHSNISTLLPAKF